MATNDAEKLYLKVEKGRRPSIRLSGESRSVQVTVPCDQRTNWPAARAQMTGGITVVVQRLEQQYKITIQHIMERKPDICVFVNALAHEREIKTCVRNISTQLSHVGVAGPNLEVTGRINAKKVTFESTAGALHSSSKLSARSVTLKAQHIFIMPEAIYSCAKLRVVSRRIQVDGCIRCWSQERSRMIVLIDAALLHIGVDGAIGASRTIFDKSVLRTSEDAVNLLYFRLTGCLANFGRIVSHSKMMLHVGGSVLSLQDSRIDSASRGYAALKQIKGVSSGASDSLPTSRTLSSAILCEKPDTVAQLLESGVDLNDLIKVLKIYNYQF
ncbi:unnamed protein product [Gongylonema pulchrum]|uniref:KH_dom_type_1 domain-containing protein n=1 Tax=Gongylonema pulchrum TaxID=637853 RepID=A0A183CXY1_9BILA|nr:unnamed protein product [Gongylonema pulchrum]